MLEDDADFVDPSDAGNIRQTTTTNPNVMFRTIRRRHNMSQVASSVSDALRMLMAHLAPCTPPPQLSQLSAMITSGVGERDHEVFERVTREKGLGFRVWGLRFGV
jgi:hypothetical protein